VLHFLSGVSSNSATWPCVYCFVEHKMVYTSNDCDEKRRNFHCKIESVKNNGSVRNFDDATGMYANWIRSGKSPTASKLPNICSQTKYPHVILEGKDYIEIMPPDSLHFKLTVTRVHNISVVVEFSYFYILAYSFSN